MSNSNVGEERAYLANSSASQSIIEGSQALVYTLASGLLYVLSHVFLRALTVLLGKKESCLHYQLGKTEARVGSSSAARTTGGRLGPSSVAGKLNEAPKSKRCP